MGNGIENGNSHSEEQDPVIPRNGLFKRGGVLFRSIEFCIFRVRTGEELTREMGKAEDAYLDRSNRVGSLIRSPVLGAAEGAQKHIGTIPQSPDKI